jgi:GDP-D-mannose 3', 5'-epimerase
MRIAVSGGGGFIPGHLIKQLRNEGHEVRTADIKPLEEWQQKFNDVENIVADLRDLDACRRLCAGADHVYNLAASMGGMGYITTHKFDCMLNVLISTHMLQAALDADVQRFFYSSSACVYPSYLQDKDAVALKESDAYPADPEIGYGWEKLFSERMCRHAYEDRGLEVRVGRYHNVYGPHGTWQGGREKAPAALCRKIAEAVISGSNEIEVWGDGMQTRSFMWIDDCIEGTRKLMESSWTDPLNIGSSELVSICKLVDLIASIAGMTTYQVNFVDGPQGVRGRNSDNTLCKKVLGWEPTTPLNSGLKRTYEWIYEQVKNGL